MTTTTPKRASAATTPVPHPRRTTSSVCVITERAPLVTSLREAFHESIELHMVSSLTDLLGGADDAAFILDGRVRDLALWPAPLLADDRLGQRPWAILLPQARHAGFEGAPSRAAIFSLTAAGIHEAAAYLSSSMDEHAHRQIEDVQYIEDQRALLLHMGDHRSFLLRLDDLDPADGSVVTHCALSADHEYVTLSFASGSVIEVPWDAILYHCDPTYTHYKGRTSDNARAARIGRRVAELRLARGLTIAALARQSAMQRPNLSRLEHGRQLPSLETLERIADALGVRVVELIAE